MKSFISLFVGLVFLLAIVPVHAGELLLGAMKKSPYQIITPDQYPDAKIQSSVEQAAALLTQAFAAQGIELPTFSESNAKPEKPAIYLGNTRFAASNGVTFEPDAGWTYTWKAVGRNLIIAGNDQPDPMPLEKRRVREQRRGGIQLIGTLKGTCEFMISHLGARFVKPGDHGLVFQTSPVLFVPDDLNVTMRPYAQDMEVSRSNDIYSVVNGMETHPLIVTNYGHYHHTVFTEEHAKTNPEYFIWRAGKRQTDEKHYCFSNPQVRELIYQKVLEDCDKGYQIIEMGQNDGWVPCDCDDCYNLYDIRPTQPREAGYAYMQDAAWGEKLWIMHRDMAQRLMKDRPGHKLLISAYSVARNPPKTFSSFPPNVMIEIMRPDREIFAKWNKLDVPGGYGAYLYTWGNFHLSGYTPLRSPFEIKELVSVLVDNDVRLIQINGKPSEYGIEGANVYAFGRMMNNPHEKPIEEHYNDYYQAAYQEAAGPMSSFYRKLHQRLMFMPEAEEYARSITRDPLLLYSTLYTPELMITLEEQLDRARKIAKDPGVVARVAGARMEFDFLKHIVQTVALYHHFQRFPTPENHERVIEAVEARNSWIKSLEGRDGRVSSDQPAFTFNALARLKSNGRYMNIEPFNWNTDARRALNLAELSVEVPDVAVARAQGPVTIDSPAWGKLPVHVLKPVARLNRSPLEKATRFQVMYDQNNLYFRVEADMNAEDMVFDARGRDAEIWLQECINLQLAPTADKSQYFYLNYEPVPDSFTDAEHGFITDPLHPQFGWNDNTWNGDWQYQTHLDKANNQWRSLVTVPFKTLRAKTPASGDMWMFNITRIHYKNQKEEPNRYKNREASSWLGLVNASNIPGDAKMGPLVFE